MHCSSRKSNLRSLPFVRGFAGLAIALAIALRATAEDPRAESADRFRTAVQPLLERYCFHCHGPERQRKKIDFSAFGDDASLARDEDLWLRVIAQVESYQMPPADEEDRPSASERSAMVDALEETLDRIAASRPPDPGSIVIHRLNRLEYENTIHDLIGVDLPLAADLPPDDIADGFDNVAEVLSISPILFEKYLDAADRVLSEAVMTETPLRVLERRFGPGDLTVKPAEDSAIELALEKECGVEVEVPADGEYELRVEAGESRSPSGTAFVSVKVDGIDTALIEVDAPARSPCRYAFTVPLRAGNRRVALRHTPESAKSYKDGEERPETMLSIASLEIAGPARFLVHRRIFFVEPGGELDDRAWAERVLSRFAARAFRRPISSPELDPYLELFARARERGRTPLESARVVLWSMLVSPRFLFRIETDDSHPDEHGAFRLDDWELASRLSYFLWSSMPDEHLFELAAAGTLQDPDVLAREVDRMLASPKAAALVESFAAQWLGLRKLETLRPDPELFPQFDEELRRAMREETLRFVGDIIREDRSVLELLDSDWTYLNGALAKLYGIRGVRGREMRRVELDDPRRGGVLTMASVLAITSYPTRTSAVKRGKWILDEILGAPPPPPPPGVPPLDDAAGDSAEGRSGLPLTLRERLERHRKDPECRGCHLRMDALGLAMENYDGVGAWRERESDTGREIDASATLPSGEAFSGPVELRELLLAGERESFLRSLTEKMLTYALGRTIERSDQSEVQRIVRELREGDYRVSRLVHGIVASYPFRYRRPKEHGPESGETPEPHDGAKTSS